MDTHLRFMYNPAYFDRICPLLTKCIPGFDTRDFILRIFNNTWPDLSLSARRKHIATVLRGFLPADFATASQYIVALSSLLGQLTLPAHGMENLYLAECIDLFDDGHPQLRNEIKQKVWDNIGAWTERPGDDNSVLLSGNDRVSMFAP